MLQIRQQLSTIRRCFIKTSEENIRIKLSIRGMKWKKFVGMRSKTCIGWHSKKKIYAVYEDQKWCYSWSDFYYEFISSNFFLEKILKEIRYSHLKDTFFWILIFWRTQTFLKDMFPVFSVATASKVNGAEKSKQMLKRWEMTKPFLKLFWQ